jgi:hypothetical protein
MDRMLRKLSELGKRDFCVFFRRSSSYTSRVKGQTREEVHESERLGGFPCSTTGQLSE